MHTTAVDSLLCCPIIPLHMLQQGATVGMCCRRELHSCPGSRHSRRGPAGLEPAPVLRHRPCIPAGQPGCGWMGLSGHAAAASCAQRHQLHVSVPPGLVQGSCAAWALGLECAVLRMCTVMAGAGAVFPLLSIKAQTCHDRFKPCRCICQQGLTAEYAADSHTSASTSGRHLI